MSRCIEDGPISWRLTTGRLKLKAALYNFSLEQLPPLFLLLFLHPFSPSFFSSLFTLFNFSRFSVFLVSFFLSFYLFFSHHLQTTLSAFHFLEALNFSFLFFSFFFFFLFLFPMHVHTQISIAHFYFIC